MFGWDESIKIDVAHSNLLTGLVMANKPKTILELGIGGGRSTDAILAGLEYNQQKYDYTLVDNWYDFGYTPPMEVMSKYGPKMKIVTSPEKEFVFSCDKQYDFIMSDADHHHTNEWFEYVYDNLLEDDGILCYHDVNLLEDVFINLRDIHTKCKERNLTHFLFNKNSIPGERCQRGFLVIFKNK
jgi:predicted O-methyltransferase YrrM